MSAQRSRLGESRAEYAAFNKLDLRVCGLVEAPMAYAATFVASPITDSTCALHFSKASLTSAS